REAEVEGNRSRAHQRDGDSHSETDGQAEILKAGLVLLDGAEIGEPDGSQRSIGRDGDEVFRSTQEHEPAADAGAMVDGTDAAIRETAERLETTGEITFEDRRVSAGPGGL